MSSHMHIHFEDDDTYYELKKLCLDKKLTIKDGVKQAIIQWINTNYKKD
jgi:hypothetical protein